MMNEARVQSRREVMNRPVLLLTVTLLVGAGLVGSAPAADDSKVKAATREVESGAKKLGQGVEDTAKGVGKTVEEGAKFTGEKIKESGKAAEPQAKSAWQHTRDGATAFGHSVRDFFTGLFSSK
jgi:hypothetical protein